MAAAGGAPTPSYWVSKVVVACLLSVAFWLVVSSVPRPTAFLPVTALGSAVLAYAASLATRGRLAGTLAALGYLAMVEPAIRYYAPPLPHFALAYGVLAVVGAAVSRDGVRRLTLPTAAIGTYLLLEAVGLLNSMSADHARAVAVPTLLTFGLLLAWSGRQLPEASAEHVIIAVVVGALSLVGLLCKALLFGEPVAWAAESSFEASGGMGPNQVSLLLAIGGLGSVHLARKSTGAPAAASLFWVLFAGTALAMVLTFSRGGAVILVVAVALYSAFSARRSKGALVSLLGLVLCMLLVSVAAERHTEGAAGRRYLEQNPGNRLLLLEMGIRMLEANPVLGVGTGNYYTAVADVDRFGVISGAHNELTRAGAEHGIPGLLVWLVWAVGIGLACVRGPASGRGLGVALAAAGLLSMVYNGSKLVAQPVLLCLALSIAERASGQPSREPWRGTWRPRRAR